jgi:hypothetical protein
MKSQPVLPHNYPNWVRVPIDAVTETFSAFLAMLKRTFEGEANVMSDEALAMMSNEADRQAFFQAVHKLRELKSEEVRIQLSDNGEIVLSQ